MIVFGIKLIEEVGADELAGGVGINAFDGNLLEAESGMPCFFKILFSIGEGATFANETFEFGFIGFEDEDMVFLHPALEGMGAGLGGRFDDAHIIEEGFVGVAGPGLKGAPEIAVGTGVYGVKIMNGDTIPAAGGDIGADDTPGELQPRVPGDGLSFPELWAAVVSPAVVGDFLGGILLFEKFVSLKSSGEGFLEGDIGDAEVVVEMKM